MGDIADAMLEGSICENCGVYLGGGAGFPQRCTACQQSVNDKASQRKTYCPYCGRKVKLIGLADHIKNKHNILKGD